MAKTRHNYAALYRNNAVKQIRLFGSLYQSSDDRIKTCFERRGQMVKEVRTKGELCVDKGLVAMFLRMSPEERLRANDNAVRTILELRNAYQQRKTNRRRPKRNT